MADYIVDVDVQVEDSQLDSLETKLKSLEHKELSVNIKTNLSNINDLSKNIKKAVESAEKEIAKSTSSKTRKSLFKELFDTSTIDTKDLNTALQRTQKLIGQNLNLGEIKIGIAPSTITGIENLENKLKELKRLAASMGSIKLSISDGIGVKNGEIVVGSQTKTLSQDLKELKQIVQSRNVLNKQLKEQSITQEEYSRSVQQVNKEIATKQNEIYQRHGMSGRIQALDNMEEMLKAQHTSIEKEYERFDKNIAKYELNYTKAGKSTSPFDKKLSKAYSEKTAEYKNTVNKIKELDTKISSLDAQAQKTELNAAIAERETLASYSTKLQKQLNNVSLFQIKEDTKYSKTLDIGAGYSYDSEFVKKSLDDLAKSLANGAKYTADYDATTGKMLATVDRGSGVLEKYALQYEQVSGLAKGSVKGITQTVKPIASYFNQLGSKLKSLSQYLLSNFGLQVFSSAVKSGISSIKELDSALTELKKTSEGTTNQYKKFIETANKDAKEIGSTTVALTSSAAEYTRLGYTLEESASLAKSTGILTNVSEFETTTEASEAMISMMKAFNVEAQNSMELVDKMNYIGNNYAISTDGIATALQTSASALVAAGNDFDKSVALVTAANSVVQDPAQVGAGIRTIALRLRGTSAETLQAEGEDTEGLVETTSKLEKQIKSLTALNGKAGVSILDINGNYRDTYDILRDISEVWEDIGKQDIKDGEKRQAALLEMMAGKNRSNILASILQNPDVLSSVYTDSKENSMGSAQKELDTYKDSVEAKLTELKETWSQIWQSDESIEGMKLALDVVTSIADVINSFGAGKTLASILGIGGAKALGVGRINYQLVL